MPQKIRWFISSLVGFSAGYLIWLTLLQAPLAPLMLAGRRGIAAALVLAAIVSLCVYFILTRVVPARLTGLQRKHWLLLLMVSLTAGILVSSYTYRRLPENRLLLPVNRLEIITNSDRHPDSSGNDCPAVLVYHV